MSKKILNAGLISVLKLLRIESVQATFYSARYQSFKKKKSVILGGIELSFRDQDVRRSRERQYSNISLFFLEGRHWTLT